MLVFEMPWGNPPVCHVQASRYKRSDPSTSVRDLYSGRVLFRFLAQVLSNLLQYCAERLRAWVNEFEVLHIFKQMKFASVLHLESPKIVSLANLMRYRGIAGAVDKGMGNAEGKQFDGRTVRVALWKYLARASKKFQHNVITESQARALDKIHGARQRNCTSQWQWVGAVKWASSVKVVSPGRPQRKLPSCRESYGQYALKIQLIARRDITEEVDRTSHISERAGPAAPFLPDPPVLDVPGRETRGGQCGAEMRMRFQPMSGAPPSPMDTYDDGEGTFSFR